MRGKRVGFAWVLGLLLSLPALAAGLHDDDFLHRLALSGRLAAYHRDAWSLYDFVRDGSAPRLIDLGLLPWFTDPAIRTRFFRPLSSALLALDVRLFGGTAWPAYLHSLLWFALVLWLVGRVHRALLPARAAFWSTLLYAVASAHASCSSWLAARHMLVGSVFALAAFGFGLPPGQGPARPRSKLWRSAVSLGLFGVGLCASEAVLAVVPLVVVERWARPGSKGRERWLDCVPLVLAALAYVAWYAHAGYGTRAMGSYVNPLESPGRFTLALSERLPQMAAELFAGLPCGLAHLSATAARWLVGLGVVSTLLVLVLFWRATREAPVRHLRALPLALFGSLLPLASPILDGRVLVLPMVVSSALVGTSVAFGLAPARPDERSRLQRFAGAVALLVFGLGLSPLARVGLEVANAHVSHLEARVVERAELHCPPKSRLLVVNGSDPVVGLYGGPLFALHGGVDYTGWEVLTAAPNDLLLERLGPYRFVLSTLGPRRTTDFERLYRSAPLDAGARVSPRGFTATVEETSSLGATRVRFDLDPAAGPACLVRWRGGPEGHLESFRLPPGGRLTLPHDPGPLGQ